MKLRMICPSDISALAESVPVLASVSLPAPATVKRVLGMAEPVLMLAAEAAGAGVPELLLVVAAVQVAKRMLSQGCPAELVPSPTVSRGAENAARPAA